MSSHVRFVSPLLAFTMLSTMSMANEVIVNCGYEVSRSQVPERIVTIKSAATDLLLALGLGDRIIGQAFADGPPLSGYEIESAAIPVLSDRLPSREVVLDMAPDFVFAGWESNVSGEGIGPRDLLADYGVGTYVAPAACRTAGVPSSMDFVQLFAQIREAGLLFGVADAAEALVAEQTQALADLQRSSAGYSAAWYSSGTDIPYMGAGTGMPQAMLDAVGLRNIAADIDGAWSSMSWEAVAAAEPDVLVLVDASWNSALQKIGLIESSPVLSKLEAVQRKRYLIVPFAASEAGVRSVPATLDLARQLRELGLDHH